MTFINEFLVWTAFPALCAAAMRAVALHTVSPRPARSRDDVPMEPTVNTLKRVHLDNPDIGVIYSGVASRLHYSSQAMVTFIFGVAPEAMLRSPRPFAVPTADLISRPGLAFQV